MTIPMAYSGLNKARSLPIEVQMGSDWKNPPYPLTDYCVFVIARHYESTNTSAWRQKVAEGIRVQISLWKG